MKKITIIPVFLTAFILNIYLVTAQVNIKSDTITSYYFHIKKAWPGETVSHSTDVMKDSIIAFILVTADSTGQIDWQSKKYTAFKKDESGYFLKADIPVPVSNSSKQMGCVAIALNRTKNGFDTTETLYGGVDLSNIKLILKTTPQGAETFLIPNRIWLENFEHSAWQTNTTMLQDYQVNTANTDTYAFVDETVYVVIFKINNQYKKIIYHTKPVKIQKEQIVWTQF